MDGMEKRFRKPRELPSSERERILGRIRAELFSRHEIVFAYAHGSFARGEAFRDIDISVHVSTGDTFDLELDLEEALSRLSGYEVDVQVMNEAPLPFRMAVLRDGKLLFSRDESVRLELVDEVSRDYRDYAHLRNVYLGTDGLRR